MSDNLQFIELLKKYLAEPQECILNIQIRNNVLPPIDLWLSMGQSQVSIIELLIEKAKQNQLNGFC